MSFTPGSTPQSRFPCPWGRTCTRESWDPAAKTHMGASSWSWSWSWSSSSSSSPHLAASMSILEAGACTLESFPALSNSKMSMAYPKYTKNNSSGQRSKESTKSTVSFRILWLGSKSHFLNIRRFPRWEPLLHGQKKLLDQLPQVISVLHHLVLHPHLTFAPSVTDTESSWANKSTEKRSHTYSMQQKMHQYVWHKNQKRIVKKCTSMNTYEP